MSYILEMYKKTFEIYMKVKRIFFRFYLQIKFQVTFLNLISYLVFYAEYFADCRIKQSNYRNNKPFDFTILPYEKHLEDINKETDLLLTYHFKGKPKITKALLNFFETTLLDIEPKECSMLEFLFVTDNKGKKYYSYIQLFFTAYQ